MKGNSRLFLEELITTPSPSGNEAEIQNVFYKNVNKYCDEVMSDHAGNVTAVINPDHEFKVLIAAHCDEIAFVVQYITDDGMIHVKKSGGIKQVLALGKTVKVMGYGGVLSGVVGTSVEMKNDGSSEVKIEDVYIDVGAKAKEELRDIVRVGDYIVYKDSYQYMLNETIAGRALDNRTGVYVIGELIKALSVNKPDVGVYAASTVNEETNLYGAYTIAELVKPDIAIVCDVTFATDYPDNAKAKNGDVKLGQGPVISFGSLINKKVNERLIKISEEHNISIQHELTPSLTGTDADKISFTNAGVPSALVSIPLRYMHSPNEVVSLNDLDQCVSLLKAFIKSLDTDFETKPFKIEIS